MTQAGDLLDLAVHAAHEAGRLLARRFASAPTGVRTKSTSTDLVSDADTEAERAILDVIRAARPGDGWLGEEGAAGESRSGLTWVVDPLDGTVNYLFRIPVWAVSIAVDDGDGTLAGVVHDPLRGETFSATRGGGAFLNGDRISVRETEDLETSLIGTGFAYDRATRAAQAEVVARVLPRVRDVRRAGSAALDLCSVACGRFDGFYEANMERWDKAAGILLVEEAGGVTSTLPNPVAGSDGVVAAGPALHPQLADLVQGA
ncbi:MAG: inositol monophosphatase [Actinomycetota bacterium]|nr:inositol monophosphatase [Actinomycetota bacterium]